MMPGSALLSHGESPHYHRRCTVSLPSSGWGRVVPALYCHQANCAEISASPHSSRILWNQLGRCFESLLERYMIKSHGQLVPVSFIHYWTSTPGLSTWSSSRALQGNQVPGETSF